MAAMAYVDLNPVRAGIAERIEQCRHTSIAERVRENSAEALQAYLAPLMSGLAEPGSESPAEVPATEPEAPERSQAAPSLPRPAITLREYVDMVRGMADAVAAPSPRRTSRVARWLARTAVLGKRQRAYGSEERLASWTRERGLQLREMPLPA